MAVSPSHPSTALRQAGTTLALALTFGLAASAVAAADLKGEVLVFGHLSQAYGKSSRGTIQATREDGTTEIGNIAVQFRWEITPDDTAVVQLSHERRAGDIFFPEQDEIAVDWAFYERRIAENTALKVGRLNVPLGIYNEVRDVGTLLPFFNLPLSFYAGVLSTAETVDGISVSHTLAARSDWDLEVHAYYGGWDTAQQQVEPESPLGLVNRQARAEDGLGVQLWLNTPMPGLRLGAGGLTWRLDGPVSPRGTLEHWNSYHLSLDVAVDRWMVRSEYRRWRFDQDFGGFLNLRDPATGDRLSLPGKAEREGFYAQAGIWATPRIGFFGQFEKTTLDNNLQLLSNARDLHEDRALSLSFRFRPDLVLRVEYHWADTQLPLGESPDQPPITELGAVDVHWLIAAMSVSF